MRQFEILSIKQKCSKLVRIVFAIAICSSQENFNACEKLLHTKGLHNVIITTGPKTFELVFDHCFRGDKQNRYVTISSPDFLCECEPIFFGHHHIKDAE